MICINLLPWRESKLKKMQRILFYQLLLIIITPCIAVGGYRVIEIAKLEAKIQSVQAYRLVNQQVLIKVESLSSDSHFSDEEKARRKNLIHMINQKNRLPGILEMLSRENRMGYINQLTLDHQTLKMKYSTSDADDSLALFQLLNSYPSFCDVSFAPVEPGLLSNKEKHEYISSYEYNAKLCDSQSN